MTPRLPLILDDRDLPAVELRAAQLDGELDALGEAFLVTDSPVTPVARAASLATRIPDRTILHGRSAAWVWGWSPEPAPLALCVPLTARIGSATRRALRVREVSIDRDEVHELAGVAVTSPERTLIDLARFDESDGIVQLLAAGMVIGRMTDDVVAAALDRRPASAGRRRARERLRTARALLERGGAGAIGALGGASRC
ncbi:MULTISPECIES: hypothetical protein [unclassified Microcella]|uniref:hypothetical protein n=1 Tax=unclassified Microcella TaxID=2630066 RepID=UPI00070187E0|nr:MULTISPECIES: hypothetical protein [unclassified Microcella]KQV24980.1 hypothetical protein ASC54_10930 [Yonghaparkia sp. Root332]KRF31265.1 hypothetical protein ASG83_10740 [Yonghaparkia sp. Soil809]